MNLPLMSCDVIDVSHTVLGDDILYPFAFDEVTCRLMGKKKHTPILHIWRHQKAFVMGLRDRRLPNASEAIEWLESQGYQVTIRNSGGAAVPLDPGVVNISWILPNHEGRMDFRYDFEMMYSLIRESLLRFSDKVEKGEIQGSYCPGDYDLSIRGKKFCGIAQRRQTKAFVVQAFINVEDKEELRGNLVKRFYDIASGGFPSSDYPVVHPERMGSLQELVGLSDSAVFVDLLKDYLCKMGELRVNDKYPNVYQNDIIKTMEELSSRYVKRRGKEITRSIES